MAVTIERNSKEITIKLPVDTSVDFLVISIVVFVVVRFVNRLKGRAQDVSDAMVVTPKDIELLVG